MEDSEHLPDRPTEVVEPEYEKKTLLPAQSDALCFAEKSKKQLRKWKTKFLKLSREGHRKIQYFENNQYICT